MVRVNINPPDEPDSLSLNFKSTCSSDLILNVSVSITPTFASPFTSISVVSHFTSFSSLSTLNVILSFGFLFFTASYKSCFFVTFLS